MPIPQFWSYKNGMHQKIYPSLPENWHSFYKYDTSSAISAIGFSRGHQAGLESPKNKPSQAKPSRLGLACITKKGFLAWLGLACKFKKRALAWFWLGISSGNSSWLYLMTFQPWHQNQTFSESLKLIVLWNLITIYKFFLSFEYWLGLTCNIILVFRLGLAFC